MLCLGTQSCPTLCVPWTVAHQAPLSMGILQARILEWVANVSSQNRDQTWVSRIVDGFFTSEPLKLKCHLKRGSVRAHSWRKPQVRCVLRTHLWPRSPGLLLLFGALAFPLGLPCGAPAHTPHFLSYLLPSVALPRPTPLLTPLKSTFVLCWPLVNPPHEGQPQAHQTWQGSSRPSTDRGG